MFRASRTDNADVVLGLALAMHDGDVPVEADKLSGELFASDNISFCLKLQVNRVGMNLSWTRKGIDGSIEDWDGPFIQTRGPKSKAMVVFAEDKNPSDILEEKLNTCLDTPVMFKELRKSFHESTILPPTATQSEEAGIPSDGLPPNGPEVDEFVIRLVNRAISARNGVANASSIIKLVCRLGVSGGNYAWLEHEEANLGCWR